eukprot:scaffold633877_cov39-Prasinocladus_malaysianus.AAC.1
MQRLSSSKRLACRVKVNCIFLGISGGAKSLLHQINYCTTGWLWYQSYPLSHFGICKTRTCNLQAKIKLAPRPSAETYLMLRCSVHGSGAADREGH